MTGPTPRVRREEVRRRLLEAAAEVFGSRGYEAARLDDIAYTAGFTKGAVYSNFAGKPALLAELIEQYVRGRFAARAVEIRAENRPERALEDIAAAFAREILEERSWSRLLVEIAQQAGRDPEVAAMYAEVRRALRETLATALTTGCDELGIELTVPADQLALTLQALLLGLGLEHGTDPERVDAAAVTAVFTDTLRSLAGGPVG
ncbi:TetR/AcrR family transcriptional regulator [Nocardia sp. NPDC003963]